MFSYAFFLTWPELWEKSSSKIAFYLPLETLTSSSGKGLKAVSPSLALFPVNDDPGPSKRATWRLSVAQLSLRAEPEANKDFSRPFPLLCQNCQFYSQPKICLLAPFLSLVCLCLLNCSGSCVSGWASLGWVACVRPVPEGQVHGPFYHTEEPHTMVRCCCVSVSPRVGFACSLEAWLFALVWHPSSVKGEQGREGRLSLGTDKRNVHIPTCRRVILAYPWVNLNLMLTKTALLWPIIPTGYVCFKY